MRAGDRAEPAAQAEPAPATSGWRSARPAVAQAGPAAEPAMSSASSASIVRQPIAARAAHSTCAGIGSSACVTRRSAPSRSSSSARTGSSGSTRIGVVRRGRDTPSRADGSKGSPARRARRGRPRAAGGRRRPARRRPCRITGPGSTRGRRGRRHGPAAAGRRAPRRDDVRRRRALERELDVRRDGDGRSRRPLVGQYGAPSSTSPADCSSSTTATTSCAQSSG